MFDIGNFLAGILVWVELTVLIFLIWHIRELSYNSKSLEKVVREMHETHKQVHEETMIIKNVVGRLEKGIKPKKTKKAKVE